jgi:hypothetical protein
MKLVEMILDDSDFRTGIHAISIVEHPAIEEDFIALSKDYEVKFAEVKKERRVLMGPALIPNKAIIRMDEEGEPFHIFFNRDTVRKASEMYLILNRQSRSTLEHEIELQGLCLVESWIIDDPKNDKSKAYGLEYPEGTWMVSMKVLNDEIWEGYVKTGKVKGFSIEGYFADAVKKKDENLAVESILKRYEAGEDLTDADIQTLGEFLLV